jgi:hypothetical protein
MEWSRAKRPRRAGQSLGARGWLLELRREIMLLPTLEPRALATLICPACSFSLREKTCWSASGTPTFSHGEKVPEGRMRGGTPLAGDWRRRASSETSTWPASPPASPDHLLTEREANPPYGSSFTKLSTTFFIPALSKATVSFDPSAVLIVP